MSFFGKIFFKQRTTLFLLTAVSLFFFGLAISIFFSQKAQALTYQELFESSKQGKVLGEIINNPVLLTSTSNKSLKITATPVSFDGLVWVYKIDWKREKQATGSMYLSLKADATKTAAEIPMAEPSGSTQPVQSERAFYWLESFL